MGFGLARIPTQAILTLCTAKDEPYETFEKILVIEETVFPNLKKQLKQEQDKKNNKEKGEGRFKRSKRK